MLSQAPGAGPGSRTGLRQLRNASLRKPRVLVLARQAIPRGDNLGCPRPCHIFNLNGVQSSGNIN